MLLTLSAAALPLSWFLLRKSGRRGALAVTVPALSFSPGTPRWFSPVPGITSLRPDLTTVPLEGVEPIHVVLATRAGDHSRLVAAFRKCAQAHLTGPGPAKPASVPPTRAED
jgi:hypothetical protein